MNSQINYNQKVTSESGKMQEISENINHSLDSHRDAIKSISVAIKEIGKVGQENSSSAEEMAANSEEIAGMTEKLKKLVENLNTAYKKTELTDSPVSLRLLMQST